MFATLFRRPPRRPQRRRAPTGPRYARLGVEALEGRYAPTGGPPQAQIYNFACTPEGNELFQFTGQAVDPNNPGLTGESIHFRGPQCMQNLVASLGQYGTFCIDVVVPPNQWGPVTAVLMNSSNQQLATANCIIEQMT
jgi:hypothetical protein